MRPLSRLAWTETTVFATTLDMAEPKLPTLWRSVLYRLGLDPGAYESAASLHPDVLLFEIEDSVPPGDKDAARRRVIATLENGGFRHQEKLVTVNGLDTPWGHADLAALARVPVDGVVLAKTEGADHVRAAEAVLVANGAPPGLRLWGMIETPRGLVNVEEIARATPRLVGLTVGLGDLSRGLNAFRFPAPNRWPVVPALASLVLAARANGLAVIDSSFREPKDREGFRAACLASRELGFDGKVIEDPALIPIANEAYGPTAEEVSWARKVIVARRSATPSGEYHVDGQHIDPQYEALAERILSFRMAIDRVERGV
jgi:citrate lyase subunit beta/citryl-CoA lyase